MGEQEQTASGAAAAVAQERAERDEKRRKYREEQDRRAINRQIWEGGPVYPDR